MKMNPKFKYQNMKYEHIVIQDPKPKECGGENKEKNSPRNES